MRFILLFLFLSMGCISIAFAQRKIQGVVLDEGENLQLTNATVMLIQAKDSILVDFVRSGENGKFSMNRPAAGEYLLIVSYPKYGDFVKEISGGAEPLNIGYIRLSSVQHLIEEVLVQGRIPIVVKGDTTEYDARSFKVEKNAKVEDLLKVLPGITVDASGKITAQGKTVEKMLVDGEEFFGEDPVLVSRNIRSDMVDKIQVYEKQSDQAEKTGVDDGKRTQTINVKLKDEAKRGMFGKAEVGAGTQDFYMGQAFLNYFNQSFRASAYALSSTNGKFGLTGEEASSIGSDDGGSGNYQGEGIPKTFNTGLYYSDKSKDKKQSWRMDYKYSKSDIDVEKYTFMRNAARDTVLSTDNNAVSNNRNDRHNVGLKYETNIDSLKTLTVWAGGNRSASKSFSNSTSMTTNQFGDIVNENSRDFENDNQTIQYNISSIYNQKFNKKGRSLSFQYYANGYNQGGEQFLNSRLSYYVNHVKKDSVIDQRKNVDNNSFNQGGTMTYSEPLAKGLVMSLEYGIGQNRDHNIVESFNKNKVTQGYDDRDDIYSNDFLYNTFKSTYNLSVNYKMDDNFFVNVSNYIEDNDLSQVDKYTDDHLKRSFLVYMPVLNGNYAIAKNRSLRFGYRKDNHLPSLNQIQPLRSNIDPLNEYLGNEELKPAYTHRANLDFWSSSLLKGAFYGFSINGSNTRNALIQNVSIDTIGKNVYRWDNLENQSNNQLSLAAYYYGLLFKKMQIRHSVSLSASFGNNYNYVNTVLANAQYHNYGLNYGLQRSTATGLDFDLSLAPGYVVQQNSIEAAVDNKNFIFTGTGNLKYFLPKKFVLRTEFNYSYQGASSVYANTIERFLINPAISKKFMKDETLQLTLMVNDLLNQNVGFNRNQSGTQLIENRYNTIGRYYMVKLSWEINKMFVKKD